MRLDSLPPAVELTETNVEALAGAAGARPASRSAAGQVGALDRLAPPATARERPRRLFHPRRGWIRRLERAVSHRLSLSFWPRVPGIERPYSRQLLRRLHVSASELRLPGLPPAFDGLRVLLLTDVHAGPFLSPAALRAVFDGLAGLRPDLILLGGDQATSRLADLDDHAAAFASLRAPLGCFAVLGNHDHATGDPVGLRRRIESCGIRVLHNRSVALVRADARLCLAGVDDALRGRPDLDRALRGTRPPVVLLSHNPDLFFAAARRGVSLMLAGHTHAGQIRVPGLPVIVRQSRFRLDEGRYRFGSSELIVSRGLGVVGLPLRVACPPEAVLLTLRGGSDTRGAV